MGAVSVRWCNLIDQVRQPELSLALATGLADGATQSFQQSVRKIEQVATAADTDEFGRSSSDNHCEYDASFPYCC